MQRTAKAVWQGTGKEGSGTLTTPSGVLSAHPYSTKLRFQDESGTNGTNPEELIAAAHAGCFTMALSFQLTASGHVPTELRTQAIVSLEQQGGGFSITGVLLKLEGNVPGISESQFAELAATAKANCPVSRALSVPITLEATLVQ
jgi:osmotically inducible protein OsmC